MRINTKPIVILSLGLWLLFFGIFSAMADETSVFEEGINFWASPVQPAVGYSAYDLLQDFNTIAPVSGLQRYNLYLKQKQSFPSMAARQSTAPSTLTNRAAFLIISLSWGQWPGK